MAKVPRHFPGRAIKVACEASFIPIAKAHFAGQSFLAYRSPQVMQLAVDLTVPAYRRDLVDEERVAISLMLSFHATGVNGCEFSAGPEHLNI